MTINARIAMLETTLRNDADVLTPDQAANLTNSIAALRTLAHLSAAPVVSEGPADSPKVAAENAKRAAAGKPKMTAEEARQFEMYSARNAEIVENACENGCEAYVDVFTFKRWIAQGFVVRKGEKSTRIDVPMFREIVDEATGTTRRIKIGTRPVPVFCRCQVKALEAKGRAA